MPYFYYYTPIYSIYMHLYIGLYIARNGISYIFTLTLQC